MRKILLLTGLMILALSGCTSINGEPTLAVAAYPSATASAENTTPTPATNVSTATAKPTSVPAPTTTSPAATSTSSPVGTKAGPMPGGSEIVVNQSLARRSITCQNESVVINGSLNQVTLTGSCTVTLINGSLNRITFDSVGSIDINGAKNEVTWRTGRASGAPELNDRGFGNQVSQS